MTRSPRQRGMTLVGLLVGTALVLLVAAGCVMLVAGHWRESRAQLIEARLTQDLRSTVDLISRSLRRSGYWGDAGVSRWQPGALRPPVNPYAAASGTTCDTDQANEAAYCLSRDTAENATVDDNEQFGFRRNPGNAAQLDMKLGAGNWQALTDPSSLRVTGFTLTRTVQQVALEALCARACPPGSSTCPPRQRLVTVQVEIEATAAGDPSVARSARALVRQRNDGLTGRCED